MNSLERFLDVDPDVYVDSDVNWSNQDLEEAHLYATVDAFEEAMEQYGVEFVLDRMSAEGFGKLKELFLGHAD
jgi:hypothetical protein